MSGPRLTTILVTATDAGHLRRTVEAMAAQTIADQIELIVISPDGHMEAALGPLLSVFHSVQIPDARPVDNVDHEVGRAIPLATAPVISTIEDHAFPDADWAERILEVYDTTDAIAVGSAMINANPHSSLSWSNMFLAYAQWSERTPEGPIDWVSVHNATFSRDAFAEYDPADYWMWFDREGTIVKRLAEKGTFHFAPRARIRHINPSNLTSTARLRTDAGRLYAANRARDEGWSAPKRVAYGGFGVAIPALRYVRMRKALFGPNTGMSEVRHGPALMAGLVFDGIGQIQGFLVGPGSARERLATFEMKRIDHLNERDRETFAPLAASSQVG